MVASTPINTVAKSISLDIEYVWNTLNSVYSHEILYDYTGCLLVLLRTSAESVLNNAADWPNKRCSEYLAEIAAE